MANTSRIKGFYPVGHLTGGEIRTMPMTLAGTVYKGDAVTAGSGGTITASSAGAGAAVVGVAAEYGVSGDVIQVWADPFIIFGVECTTAVAATDVFVCTDHVAGSGSALTYLSGHYVDLDGNGQCRILGLVDAPGNAWGANAQIKIVFAEHAFTTVAGI